VTLEADRVAAATARPVTRLTRRDVARACLAVPARDALAALPSLREQLVTAGNPLSAVFWTAAQETLTAISAGEATNGDVQQWLEATGTEPNSIIGMHVWEDEEERSALQAEMHGLLVAHLEELVEAGEIEPDLLASGNAAARRAYAGTQERWMMATLPDGRVPMDVLLDEKDEEFFAAWDEADAEALSELRAVLAQVGDRPCPGDALREACRDIRLAVALPGGPGPLLAACGGLNPHDLPRDDAELWLTLAAGVVSPQDDLSGADESLDRPGDDEVLDELGDDEVLDGLGDDVVLDEAADTDFAELGEDAEFMAAIFALDHFDWLAATSALARGGPGTPASESDLSRYVREYDTADTADTPDTGEQNGAGSADENLNEDDPWDPDEAEDQEAAEELFGHVVPLWQALGAIDDDARLTPLGWWGLPEGLQRAWAPRG